MTDALLARVSALFFDHIPDLTGTLEAQTAFTDITGWDSLARIHLVLAVEKEFAIQIAAQEVVPLRTIGDLLRLIQQKNPLL